MKQFIGFALAQKSERCTRANNIVAHATVHLKKMPTNLSTLAN